MEGERRERGREQKTKKREKDKEVDLGSEER